MDDAQLTAAYRQYFPVLQAKCARMCSDHEEAADVAQETFIRLWQSELVGQAPEQVSAWIYRTSTRVAIDRLRQRSRQRVLHQQAMVVGRDPGGGPAGAGSEQETALVARRLFEHLASQMPEDELEVAILSRLDLLTHAEIAEVAARSERTVRRLLHRFDERLLQLPEELRP